MRRVALVAVFVTGACKGRKDCDAYLDELKAWAAPIDDRLAAQHVVVPLDTVSATAKALDPVAARSSIFQITKTELAFDGSELDNTAEHWERVFEAARIGDPVAIVVAPDAPWWRVVVGAAVIEDTGVSGARFVFLADPIPPPPRADREKFALPEDSRRIDRYAEWTNRIIDRCPSFGSLMWPQRGHDATPREMAIAAKDCGCEIDPVEISSWFAYDLTPTLIGIARTNVGVLDRPRLKASPDDVDAYLKSLRDELTVAAAGPRELAAPADTPWREVAAKLVGATAPIKLRILR